MSLNNTPNYNARQPNNTSYIKTYVSGPARQFWKIISQDSRGKTLTPLSKDTNVLITSNLYLEGGFFNTSDIRLKENISPIQEHLADNIMDLNPCEYTFKNDNEKKIHYGFLAQELKHVFPELVQTREHDGEEHKETMVVNILEMVPLIVQKMKKMQEEMDVMKQKIDVMERERNK
jgi:hypothetical protein